MTRFIIISSLRSDVLLQIIWADNGNPTIAIIIVLAVVGYILFVLNPFAKR